MYYDCGKQSGIKPHVPLGQAYLGARVAHLKWPEQRQPPPRRIAVPMRLGKIVIHGKDTGSAGRSDHPMLQRGELVSRAAWAGRSTDVVTVRTSSWQPPSFFYVGPAT